MANEKLIVELTAQIQGLKSGLDSASKEIGKFNSNTNNAAKNSEKDFNQIGAAAGKIGGVLAGVFAAGSLLSFGKSIVETTAKFETFGAVLTNTLGSASQAQMAMQMITEFATKTPFSVEELTGAFVKLANQGFKPSYEEMRKLGDLASSTGKSFNQLAEAILDAQTGEFERLKEFGVKAAVAGDQVTFSFKGVATTVKNTSESIQEYLLGLGDVQGVSGSMAAISQTLQGRISNLGDAFTTLMKNLGDSNSGVLKTTIDRLTQLVTALNTIGNADNMSEKLGIDQRGVNWMDNIPFAELQNIFGSVTYGQQANINLIDSYEKLNSALSKIRTSGGFESFITSLEKARTTVKETSPYYKIYTETINNAKDALAALTAEEVKAAAKAKALAGGRKVEKQITFIAPAIGISQIPNAPGELGLQDPAKRQAAQIARDKDLAQQAKMNAYLIQQNEILTASTLLMSTLQSGFEQMFTTIVDGGQNAFQGVLDGLKRLMIKIAAAIVAATILFFLTGGASAGGNAIKKIGELAKTMGGLGFNPFTLFSGGGGQSPYIAMPSSSTGQGGYQVDIMGDKMRMLLDNTAIKNSRVI